MIIKTFLKAEDMTPHVIFEKIRKKISFEIAFSFLSTVVIGLIAHFFIFTNYLPNWDGFNNFYDSQNTISLGRCFLSVACGLTSFYDLPWINGLISLFYLGAISVLISSLLGLFKKSSRFILSGILVSFPVITSTFSYMYTADGYILALLCMTLAIFFTINYKKGFIPGLFLICFATGCYQATITFASTLILVISIKKLLIDLCSAKELLKLWVKLILTVLFGLILYFLSNKILLLIQNVNLANYQGIGNIHLVNPITSALNCIIDFAYFFIGSISKISFYSILNLILFVFIVYRIFSETLRKGLIKKSGSLVLLILSLLLIPFSCFAIYFISDTVHYHTLMQSGLFMIYALAIVLYENLGDRKFEIIQQWAFLILSLLIMYNFILLANICYQKQNIAYQKSMKIVDSIVTDIRKADNGGIAEEIAILGHLSEEQSISIKFPPEMVGFTDSILMTSSTHYANILQTYYSMHYTAVSEEKLQELSASLDPQMPAWPEDGSVFLRDNTLIINFEILFIIVSP